MRIRFYLSMIILFVSFGCSNEESTKNYLFKNIPKEISNIDFINQIKEDATHNIISYIYFYNGGGVAVGDINNDGLSDIYFVSNQGENKLYLNKGNFEFEDISRSSGTVGSSSWNTGSTMIDINSDGYLDIYVCSVTGLLDFKGHNELFINNGNGTFTEQSKQYGLDFKGFSTQSYFFDYDKDDDLDVYIVNHAIHTAQSHGLADVRNKRVPLVGDVLLKNDNGKFFDVSEKANIYGGVNGYGLSASIADLNHDGWEDIYVSNDFHEDDYYYINQKDGTFKENLESSFSTISRFSMGSDTGDINGDGYLDLITLDMLPSDERVVKESEGDDVMLNMKEHLSNQGYKDQYSRNMLQINNSGQYFKESSILYGVSSTDWSWSALIADFDNDSYQDLYITTGILRRPNNLDFKQYVSSALKRGGSEKVNEWLYKSIDEMPSGMVPNQIYQGNSKKFSNRNGDWIANAPSLSNGAVYVDLDNDGDLDLVTNKINAVSEILENTTDKTKNYLSLQLHYKESNLEGIGSEVLLYTENKVQVKTLSKSRGFLSSVDSYLHFGLDSISKIDSIKVVWPNLTTQTILKPLTNQRLIVDFDKTKTNSKHEESENSTPAYFEEVDLIRYTHVEDSFRDSDHQRLIPYSVSTQGPSLDIADFDGNKYKDLFIGSAAGSKSVMYSNNGLSFSRVPIPAIENDSIYEDNDAHFFDADNDGDLDLYIASGIISSENRTFCRDRIYINSNGSFVKSENRIPLNEVNTSVVVSSDYDSDGDLDLFIGNLSDTMDFGLPVQSFLLNNDGKGNFSIDENFKLSTKVNDAVWQDLNGDGIQDLLVATEWDQPRIFLNINGKLSETLIAEGLKGLWQTITCFDIDGDEDLDILLGNWGLNTKLSAKGGPIKMYYNDFDRDQSNEVILAYPIGKEYYPINSRDELTSQMKFIGKKFVSYKDFALKSVGDIVGEEVLSESTTYEINQLASGYLENNNNKFTNFIPFNDCLQVAPINSFTELQINGGKHILASGNSFKVNTYHGGYSSLKGILIDGNNQCEMISNYGVDPFSTQISTTATIPMKNKNLLLILSNNSNAKSYIY